MTLQDPYMPVPQSKKPGKAWLDLKESTKEEAAATAGSEPGQALQGHQTSGNLS